MPVATSKSSSLLSSSSLATGKNPNILANFEGKSCASLDLGFAFEGNREIGASGLNGHRMHTFKVFKEAVVLGRASHSRNAYF